MLQFQRKIFKLCYYYALLVAVCPVPLDLRTLQVRPSRLYTLYCAIVHLLLLALIPYTYSSYIYERSYMRGRPVLQWVYNVSNSSRSLAIVMIILGFWLQRTAMIGSYTRLHALVWRFRHTLRWHAPENMQLKRKMVNRLLLKVCTANLNALFSGAIFFNMNNAHDADFMPTVLVNYVLTLFVAKFVNQFFILLTLLRAQFQCSNQQLLTLISQLKALESAARHGDCDLFTLVRAPELEHRLAALSALHYDCFWLTRHCFRICEVPALGIMLQIVLMNICNLYHAVLFLNHSLKINDFSILIGSLLTLAYYCDTILLVSMLDNLLLTCNETGLLLRECTELLHLRNTKLNRTLEHFSLELMCRRLSYDVCGLFNMNRTMALKWIFIAIVQVTVLMQFDLKSG